jgi:histidinol-phosphate aminotransferase
VPLDAGWDLATASLHAALRMAEPNLIFIASPNNPTGNKMSEARLIELIEAAPRSLVVVDEAYIDYSDHDQLELYRRYENVAILRTLSKIGFAALRVGWLIARAPLIREIDKVRLPYNMPTLSQVLGTLAVTELAPEIRRITSEVIAERKQLAAELAKLPRLAVHASQANFLWLHSERPAAEIFEGLKQRGVLVRSFHQRGGRLSHQLRVTIGTHDENQALLEGMKALV